MKLIIVRHGDPDYENDTLTERGWKEAKALSEESGRAYREACVGQVLPVLFESEDVSGSIGHSDTYLRVQVPEPGLRGQLRRVKILSAGPKLLQGRLLPE